MATPVPTGQFGYYLMARTQSLVPLFGGSQGNLCLGLPLVRFRQDILVADAARQMRYAPDLTALPQSTTFLPGETWTFQCWFRDLNPALTSNTSSALAITFRTAGAPTVQFPVAITDALEDAVAFELPVTLSQVTDVDVPVSYSVAGTATSDVDYQIASPNPLVVPAGRSTALLRVEVLEDAAVESDNELLITLLPPTGALLGTSVVHEMTIRNDD
ncbi:MAG: hypothetical protein GY711_05695 [bacterium]|nr:hypothetical protein [bacterium]